jgi:hypothetical protein
MENEIRIPIPEGMEIDRENSTFECIKFKPIEKKRWRDDKNAKVEGYYISNLCVFRQAKGNNVPDNYNVFATEKQAKSALAMARISQIMANDERFGGAVTDEEWKDDEIVKHVIMRDENCILKDYFYTRYHFLAFHTEKQRDLFLKENEDLVKDYLML